MDIKICGLTNLADALAAAEEGADFLGFVLYSRSPRGISGTALRRIAEKLGGRCRLVGVFVNEQPRLMAKIASDCGLCAVQLHGDEQTGDIIDLSVPAWRAVRIQDNGAAIPLPEQWPAERYVVEAFVPGVYGGTGKAADWPCAAALAKRFPVMLAGGLTPDNVGEALRTVQPAGVDVAGGVESEPGKKDRLKLKAFITAVRTAISRPDSS